MKAIGLVILAAGCLSEPARPHGLGPPIADGSVLGHRTAVGDLNGDGYDDLVTWGNEGAPGTNPTVFVYFGGETLENPDLRADLTIAAPDLPPPAWFEALDASIFVSADASVRGVAIMSAQDTGVRDDPQSTRFAFGTFLPIEHRAFGERQITAAANRNVGGYAPYNNNTLTTMRDTRSGFPARQLILGNDTQVEIFASPTTIATRGDDSSFGFPDEQPHYVHETLRLPDDGTSEDLLVITGGFAYRTNNDGLPAFTAGTPAMLGGAANADRLARGRVRGDEFFAVATNSLDPSISIIDVLRGADPIAYTITGTAQLDDLAIADVGGDDRIDVVGLDSGSLGVYRDLTLGPTATSTELVASRDSLVGYDLLAVGNFHGDARLEIYVLSTLHPERGIVCYRMTTPTTVARCTGE